MENKNAKNAADGPANSEFELTQFAAYEVVDKVETGWLLDNGLLCIGAGPDHGLGWVTYTDPNAIRFARQQDAEAFTRVLRGVGFNALAAEVKPVEHQWG